MMKRIFCISILCLGLNSFANPNTVIKNYSTQTPTTSDIIATISKDTTEEQFQEMIAYFKENGITVNINEIKYNDKNEITGIQILLKKDGQQSSYSMNTNIPIDKVELGYKNGQLFVTSAGNNQLSFGNGDINSLMQQFQNNGMTSFDLNSLFNDQEIQDQLGNFSQFFQGSFGNMDEMMEQMKKQFGNMSTPPSIQNKSNAQKGLPKYSFINKPDINKLIIIDGKESDFETLNNLAQTNKLDTVESLKPVTAMSIYGDKAKDGAVIATTIKK